jgi:hypothetical protein
MKWNFILLNKSIWAINLALNTKRNEDRKENSNKVAIPVNAPFLPISLEGAILLSHTKLRLST